MGGDGACQGIPEKGIRHTEDTMLLVAPEPARDRHAGLAEPLHGKVGVGNLAQTGGQSQGGGKREEGQAPHAGVRRQGNPLHGEDGRVRRAAPHSQRAYKRAQDDARAGDGRRQVKRDTRRPKAHKIP